MRVKLTQSFAERVRKPGTYRDTMITGFQIHVTPAGTASYRVDIPETKTSKRRMKTLGRVGIMSFKDAQEAAIVALLQGLSVDHRDINWNVTFRDVLRSHYSSVSRSVSRTTLDQYSSYYRAAGNAFAEMRIADITAADVEAAITLYYEDKPVAANRFLTVIGGVFNRAVRDGYIQANPCNDIKKNRETPRDVVLTASEWERLGNKADQWFNESKSEYLRYCGIMMKILMHTGMRQGEVTRMQWSHVDMVGRILHIPDNKSGNPQQIPLNDAVVAELGKLKMLIPSDSDFVINTWVPNGWWRAVFEAAGIKNKTCHDIRRTYGLRVSRKHGLHVAQKLLRHSDIRTTERVYAPLDHDMLLDAANDLE